MRYIRVMPALSVQAVVGFMPPTALSGAILLAVPIPLPTQETDLAQRVESIFAT